MATKSRTYRYLTKFRTEPFSQFFPMVPPTANHIWKHTRDGRTYLTEEARSFKDAIRFRICNERPFNPDWRLQVEYHFLVDSCGGDLANYEKLLSDALGMSPDTRRLELQEGFVFCNDNRIDLMVMQRTLRGYVDAGVRVTIKRLEE